MPDSGIDQDAVAVELRSASAEERRLWSKVRGKHRGQAGHDPKAWGEWLGAATQVQFLARLLRAARESPPQRKGKVWS
jgi:hypothetical protein